MTFRRQIAVKIMVIIILIVIGMAFVIYGLLGTSSIPEGSISYQKNFPEENGNVVVILYPQKAFVPDDDLTAIVAISLPNDYVAKHHFAIEACFPDAWLSYNGSIGLTRGLDTNFYIDSILQVGNFTYTTYSRVVNVKYVSEGTYGLNVTILDWDTHNSAEYSFSNVVQIKPSTYLTDKIRSDSAYALNYEILGLTIIMLAPIFVQLSNLIEKIRGKEKKKEKSTFIFVGDDR